MRRRPLTLQLPSDDTRRWLYGLAPVVATVVIRWLLEPMLEEKSPFLLFTLAVLLAATFGGVWVGVTGAAIGGAAGLFFLADTPRGPAEIFKSGHLLQLALYLLVCGGLAYLIEALHRIRRKTELFAAEQTRLAEQLAQANRAKDDFLATLSHELRTPLSAIVGWAEALETGRLTPAQTERAIETINHNSRVQAQLISDMLDVARITSGKLRLDPRPVNPSAVVGAAIETVAPAALARNIELRAEGDPVALVWGDPDRLQQVVWNLLSNAIKFTPPSGHVRVQVRRVDRNVHLTVTDSGPGLRPEFIGHAFERFRQDAEGQRSPGLGLGLAIVKHLVEMHGGTVSAANRDDGRGAVFEVVLPQMMGAVAVRRSTDAEAVRSRPPSRTLAGLYVLVVDDDPDARDLLEWILNELGADVATAASVPEALSRLVKRRPDVILADIAMPGQDGFALLEQARALAARRGGVIPTAALTAGATDRERDRALDAGFDLHLAKPIRPERLAEAVLSLANRQAI
jgi:signal transduction histidine kinase/ActR/RegA family two-component response regulator